MTQLQDKILAFPTSPGVYLMKDEQRRIIYVGKAKNLRQRVKQYFSGQDQRGQIEFLMKKLADIDFLQTNNEKEALILENSLIKKHKPHYNVFLKDDKTYLGLRITVSHDFPRLTTTRRIKKDGSLYYGPFTSADALYQVKEFIDRFFQLRTCSDSELNNRTRPCLEYQIKRCSAPCVGLVDRQEYAKQIQSVLLFLEGKGRDLQKMIQKKMSQASAQEKFEEAARLRDLLNSMESVLEKQSVTGLSFDFVDVLALKRRQERTGIAVLMVRDAQLIDSRYYVFHSLEDEEEMIQNFVTQYYSEQSFIPKEILVPIPLKDSHLLESLLSERSGYKVMLRKPFRGEKKDLLELAIQNLESHFIEAQVTQEDRKKRLQNIQQVLHLRQIPLRMECFDVSNISGSSAVGSMVTFVDGDPFKQGYRRFKIRSLKTPDDYGMMYEILERRFKKMSDVCPWPDLLVVDGGKGQLNVARKVLKEMQIDGVEIVAIAKGRGEGARAKGIWRGKKEEEIFLEGRKNPVKLRSGSPALQLLQNLRDESHRFAISYHRKIRDEKITGSWLDNIPGLGKKKQKDLIKVFGSASAIKKASLQDLMVISGIGLKLAQQIKSSTP